MINQITPMLFKSTLSGISLLIISFCNLEAQVVINEGSNKNYIYGVDEEGDNEDWIELYNAGGSAVDLSGYHLSDKSSEPDLWPLTGIVIQPNNYLQIFCSEKNDMQQRLFLMR